MSRKYLILMVSELWTRQACRGRSESSSNFGTLSFQVVNSMAIGSTQTSKTLDPGGSLANLNSFMNHFENSILWSH